MRFNKLLFASMALVITSPLFASSVTYWGGFEDSSGSGSDYDYNDLVFSISGSNLTLNTSTGLFFNKASAGALNTSAGAHGLVGTPFWNNSSLDGPGGYNVGWCIYGGGVCNGGAGLAPSDNYLATIGGMSVNDVYFSVNGSSTEQVHLAITALTDTLGWELKSGGPVHMFPGGVNGPLTFTPGGDFVLVGSSSNGASFTSNMAAGDGVSHFAFFGAQVPEPSTYLLVAFPLLSYALLRKKKQV